MALIVFWLPNVWGCFDQPNASEIRAWLYPSWIFNFLFFN